MDPADSSTRPPEREAGSSFELSWALDRLGRLVVRRARAVAGLVLLLAALAALAAALGLRVHSGYLELLAPDSPINARYATLLEELGSVEALYLVVDSEREGSAAFVDAIGPELLSLRDAAGAALVRDALSRVDLGWFRDRLSAFLPEEVLAEGSSLDRSALEDLAADPRPELLVSALATALRSAALEGEEVDGGVEALEAVAALVGELGRAAEGDEEASLGRVLLSSLAGDSRHRFDEDGRVRLADGSYLVTVTPADESNDFKWMSTFLSEVLAAEERVLARLGTELTIRHAGAPVLVVDEMQAAHRDVTRSTLVALVLVSALFLASFHSLRHVGAAVAALLAGLALTFGAALIMVGSLNLFSVVFAAVLVGLGIDFGIHVVNGYEGGRRLGHEAGEAVRASLRTVGPATLFGAVTTAAAFFSTTTSDFRGFSQLGLITGVGVLLCLVCAFTLLPALLVLLAPGERQMNPRRPWSLRLLALPVKHAKAASLLTGALVLAGALSAPGLHFDYDLLALQPEGTEAAALSRGAAEERVQTHVAFSLSVDLEEAAGRAERFRALPAVAAVSSAADLLPSGLERRSAGLARLAARLRPAGDPSVRPQPIEPEDLRLAFAELRAALEGAQDLAFEAGRSREVLALEEAMAAVDEAVGRLGGASVSGLAGFRDRSRAELAAMARTAALMAQGRGASATDLPEALRARLVGSSGRLAIVIEPVGEVWDRPALEEFVAQLRSVDPEVTGPPIQILEITEMMRRSYERAALVAFLVIALIVAAALRSLLGTVLTLLPLIAGFLLTLGALRWMGVALNPANLVALPLILGIGVDNGLHVAHRWMKLRDASSAIFEVGHAIVVTSLTTVAGFTGLLIASHRGVRSLGAVAVVGTLAMLLCSVVLLPAVVELLSRGRRASPP